MEKKKVKILVLDDEKIVLDSVSRILGRGKLPGQNMSKGEQAVETLKEGGFDILITDLKMPGMDGLQAMESMLEIDPDLSVIMFTAYSKGGFCSKGDENRGCRLYQKAVYS